MQYNIFQARNKKYIEHLFYSKPRIFLGSGKHQQDVQKIEIKAVSPSWAEKTCLTKYTIFFRDNTTKKIRSTASNQELLKNAWTVMDYLSQSNNSKIKRAINPPLYFSPRLNLLFYEEIPGDTLTNIFEFNAENNAVIKPYLLHTAQWLAVLHSFRKTKSKIKPAILVDFQEHQQLLTKIKKKLPELKPEISNLNISFLKDIEKLWNSAPSLIHNDFYLGNIIANQDCIFVIDFEKAGWGFYLMDIATFVGSLEFPHSLWHHNIHSKYIKKAQDIFIQEYCRQRNIKIEIIRKDLKFFLAKIFLDQLRYLFLFNYQNIKNMPAKDKNNLVLKLKDIISKINYYQSQF